MRSPALYGLEPGYKLDPAQLKELQEAAERRQREHIEVMTTRRRRRRVEAERLLAGATPARPGDPASRYLLGRGLSDLTGVWYHPTPVITTSHDQERPLAPSVLFEVTEWPRRPLRRALRAARRDHQGSVLPGVWQKSRSAI